MAKTLSLYCYSVYCNNSLESLHGIPLPPLVCTKQNQGRNVLDPFLTCSPFPSELSITLLFLNSFLKVISIFQHRFAEALTSSWMESIETTLCYIIWNSFWLMDLDEVNKMLSQLSPGNLGLNLAPPDSLGSPNELYVGYWTLWYWYPLL